MATTAFSPSVCLLNVNCFDGARSPLSPEVEVLVTILDGYGKRIHWDYLGEDPIPLPFYNNNADNLSVIASAKGFRQAGFAPVKLTPSASSELSLMLLKKNASFNFERAQLKSLKSTQAALYGLITDGVTAEAAKIRWSEMIESRPAVLACLLNITTALEQILMPSHTAMYYLRELIWDSMKQDRFFAWADLALLDQVRLAAQQGQFVPEYGSAAFHKGATCSFKQVQFGEANVQITFHESTGSAIRVELDMDYYKDPAAHALLELLPNSAFGSLTDPKLVYVLRWIAGLRAGVPPFNPPYALE